MAKYSTLLAKLKCETNEFKKRQRKPLKEDQQIVYNLIHGQTKEAKYYIKSKDITVILKKGDERKGLYHILKKHYCDNCNSKIKAKDILNFFMIIEKGLKISSNNPPLIAFRHIKGIERHFIILNPIDNERTFVVTFYNEGL